MSKWYGSLFNRLEEGYTPDNIKVGMGVTQYYYSDREPYEVTKVIDQKHIFIRALDYKRTDDYGMSECQVYEYTSKPDSPEIELVRRNNAWYSVDVISKETLMERARERQEMLGTKSVEIAYNYLLCMWGLTEKQYENIELGKQVKKYQKMNISIGRAEAYYDYSF